MSSSRPPEKDYSYYGHQTEGHVLGGILLTLLGGGLIGWLLFVHPVLASAFEPLGGFLLWSVSWSLFFLAELLAWFLLIRAYRRIFGYYTVNNTRIWGP